MARKEVILFGSMFSRRDYSFVLFFLAISLLPVSINFSTFALTIAILLKIGERFFLKSSAIFCQPILKYSAVIGICFFCYIIINSIVQNDFSTLVLERDYSHFALFFLVPLLLRNPAQNKLLLYGFFIGLILTVILGYIYSLIYNKAFNRNLFLEFSDLHHTYLVMYLLLFENFILGFFKSAIRKHRIWILLVSTIILTVIFLMDSKVGIIIFFLLGVLHFTFIFKKHLILISIFCLILFGLVFTFFNNKIETTYEEALKFRYQLWQASFEVVQENPFFGDSSQSEKDVLNYRHYVNGMYYFVDSDLNSHNQYLSILMRFGIIGFIILLIYILQFLRNIHLRIPTILSREAIGALTIFAVICLTENILDRHHGIVCFSFIINYYLVATSNAKS